MKSMKVGHVCVGRVGVVKSLDIVGAQEYI